MTLEVRGVKKRFGELEVLRGINLKVEQGDVVAILGSSGSGKTTLLRCVNFLEQADSGALIFDGETFDLGRMSQKDVLRLRKKTAFVFQNYNLFLNKTALENVTEGLITARKMPKAEAVEKAKRALDRVGMLERASHYPSQLSGGQQQRVAIARAIATRSPILMADEPTGALDSKTGAQVLELMRRLNAQGTTVILITHDNGIAAQADRTVRVMDGHIVHDSLWDGVLVPAEVRAS